MPSPLRLADLIAAQTRGDKSLLSQALAALEREPESGATLSLLDEAWNAARAHVIGLTGPPGVGKSTLAGALIRHWRAAGISVGVIAVDPSSRKTGGALLGDRTRLRSDPDDPHLFIRSMAARDRLGGLADLTLSAMIVMRALFDRVLVETVGVGQSETDIADAADSVIFCVQPGSGDGLQFMKAGIVEIPDIVAVTKSDLGPAAERARSDVAGALTLAGDQRGDWRVPVLTLSAQSGVGIDALASAIDRHRSWLAEEDRLTAKRGLQAENLTKALVLDRFGRDGLKRIGHFEYSDSRSPFRRVVDMAT